LSAIAHNVRVLNVAVAPARVCAVVKADGYGHGAVPVARAAVDAGARWLAVALADEGATLRDAGIAAPILLLSEPSAPELEVAVANDLRPTVYTEGGIEAAAKAARRAAAGPVAVHLKVDTGMHRVGAAPEDAVRLAEVVRAHRELRLEAVWTHCAAADEPSRPITKEQLRRFDRVLDDLDAAGLRPPMVHAANSAAGLGFPEARFDMVRAGIAVYGIAPGPEVAGTEDLRPALQLKSMVSFVKRVAPGEGVSYGHHWHADRETVIATVPLGYADGVPRRLGLLGADVLIRGRRRPIAGVVTMDQLTVDCGDDDTVTAGDEVVLIGRQGDEHIPAEEWAEHMGTIAYEVVCDIGPRVPRRYR
jgi:alanine racemase